jgi:hypothetical protein
MSLQLIAHLVGHGSLETTRCYIQPGREDLAASVDKPAGGMIKWPTAGRAGGIRPRSPGPRETSYCRPAGIARTAGNEDP